MFPINQDFPAGHIVPRHGIYVCLCAVGETYYPAVASVGIRPSVDSDGHVNCETHLLDYDGDLYGQTVRVYVLDRLRGERRFASADELKKQIELDKTTTIGQNPPLSEAARWEGESHL